MHGHRGGPGGRGWACRHRSLPGCWPAVSTNTTMLALDSFTRRRLLRWHGAQAARTSHLISASGGLLLENLLQGGKKSNTRGVAHFARTYRTLSVRRGPHADCQGNDSSGIKRGVHVVLSSVEQRHRVAMEHRGWTR
jgi:hypothetical protein